jgi:transitional endoplasmic reticulum ATPase
VPAWRVRDFHDDDLDQVIALWDQSRPSGSPVFGVSEAMAAVRAGHPAVVALAGDELIGAVVARVDGERAWVLLIALAARWRNRGVGSSLLAGLEGRLRGLHVRRVSAVVPEDAAGSVAMRNSGYQVRDGLTYYEKAEHFSGDAGLLAALGGRLLPRGLWDTVAGMGAEKEAIEQRIVLPLAHPSFAERYGVAPPKAAILFGPPDTGKTSFAKAVASRLDWPFVEHFPARLVGSSELFTPADIEFAARKAPRPRSSARCATAAASPPPPTTTCPRSRTPGRP